jgi:hypothetical protein
MLEDREEQRQQELSLFSTCTIENEHVVSSLCSIFDGIYREGSVEVIIRLTNFSPREFNVL